MKKYNKKPLVFLITAAVLLSAFAGVLALTSLAAAPVSAKAYTVTGDANSIYIFFTNTVTEADVTGTYPWIANQSDFTCNADQVTLVNEHLVKYNCPSYAVADYARNGSKVLYIPTWGAPVFEDLEYTPLSSVAMWGSPRPDCFVMDVYNVPTAGDIGDPDKEVKIGEPVPLGAASYTVTGDSKSVYVLFDRDVTAAEVTGSFLWISDEADFTVNAETVTVLSSKLVKYTSIHDIANTARAGGKVFFINGWGNPSVFGTVLSPLSTLTLWNTPRSDCFVMTCTDVASVAAITGEAPSGGEEGEGDGEQEGDPSAVTDLVATAFTVTGDKNSIYVLYRQEITEEQAKNSFPWVSNDVDFIVTANSSVTCLSGNLVKYTNNEYEIGTQARAGAKVFFIENWGSPVIPNVNLAPLTVQTPWEKDKPFNCYMMKCYNVGKVSQIAEGAGTLNKVKYLKAWAFTVAGDSAGIYVLFNNKVSEDAVKGSCVWITKDGNTQNADHVTVLNEHLVKYSSANAVADIANDGGTVFFIMGWGNPAFEGYAVKKYSSLTLWADQPEYTNCYVMTLTPVGSVDEIAAPQTADSTVYAVIAGGTVLALITVVGLRKKKSHI